jgi:hypothetical protein
MFGVKSAPTGRNVEALKETVGLRTEASAGFGDDLPNDDTGRKLSRRVMTIYPASNSLENIIKSLRNRKNTLSRLGHKLKAQKTRDGPMNIRNNNSNTGTRNVLSESRFKNLWRKLSNSVKLNRDRDRGGVWMTKRGRGEKSRVTGRERDFLIELIASMKETSGLETQLVCGRQCLSLLGERLRLSPRMRDEQD